MGITNSRCALGLQNQPLYSSDGRVYLRVQGDGNLVLYSVQVANLFGQSFTSAIFATGTYGATPGPFSLVLQQVPDIFMLCRVMLLAAFAKDTHALVLRCRPATLCCSTGMARKYINLGSQPTRAPAHASWWSQAQAAAGLPSSTPETPRCTRRAHTAPRGPSQGRCQQMLCSHRWTDMRMCFPTVLLLMETHKGNLCVVVQDSKLYSWDGTVCLIAQGDGKCLKSPFLH